MMPNVHVLVSYVREDGEIVADFTEITVAVALENQVRNNIVLPGCAIVCALCKCAVHFLIFYAIA